MGGMGTLPLKPYFRTVSTRITWRWMIKKLKLKLYRRRLKVYRPAQLVKGWRGQYVRDVDPRYDPPHKITKSAIGFHPDGSLMFLFLKDVIPQALQNDALVGLKAMKFKSCDGSNRKELKEANVFNATLDGYDKPVRVKGRIIGGAGELNYGFYARSKIDTFIPTRKQRAAFEKVLPILNEMCNVFARRLPKKFMEQNKGFTDKQTGQFRRVPVEFRLANHTPFSSVAILKSAPSAVHTDGKNGDNFACMTSIQDPTAPYSGGAFCFVEYGVQIAVRPGDFLIASTPTDWHANLTRVVGEKYSVVAYFKQVLANPRLLGNWRMLNS
jgi:hypothetical protein